MATITNACNEINGGAARRTHWAMRLFLVFCLLLLSGAMQRILGGDTVQGSFAAGYTREDNSTILVVGALTFASAGALLLLSGRLWLPSTIRYGLLLNAFAVASALWSVNPSYTFVRSLGLTGCSVIAIWTITTFSFEEFCRQLVHFCVVLIVGTTAMAVVAPDFSYHSMQEIYQAHGGLLKGPFVHKNTMAKVLSLCLLALVAFGPKYLGRFTFAATLIAGIILLAQTDSAQAFASVPVGLGVAWVLTKTQNPKLRLALVAYGLIAWLVLEASGLVDIAFDVVLQSLGRDSTLSGRTLIWEAALTGALQQNYVIGGGYEAAWQGIVGNTVRLWLRSNPGHPHSGYINTYLELGLVGCGIVFAHIFSILRQLSLANQGAGKSTLFFTTAWAVVFLVSNLSGTYVMLPADLYWYLFLITPALFTWQARSSVAAPQSTEPAGSAL